MELEYSISEGLDEYSPDLADLQLEYGQELVDVTLSSDATGGLGVVLGLLGASYWTYRRREENNDTIYGVEVVEDIEEIEEY